MDIIADLIPDDIMESAKDAVSSVLAVVLPIVIIAAALILLRLILPPILNKINEKRVYDVIRDGEEIPQPLHSAYNKKKHVPAELLPKLQAKLKPCDLSWTQCSKYAQILRSRAKIKHYINRDLCIMLEVKKCKPHTIDITHKCWHIAQKKNRLTKLISFTGHFYLKAGEVVLKVDEKTYAAVNKQAIVVLFELESGVTMEVFA
jgi:hypothetical protein